ncbi:uncharacterized protein EI90DRAFT_3017928 [Cantharellus anzutake]|uniref:uncharacterized protein n=1 Tax=Cantharellus anzutake TaxID=1750568 RepID=UPI001905D274|nr:uncharacterized protein EI90DRAFT_3017928 [Cantharellus anzutake]KAF8327926.1 hypothetical protein EI90DRAFT_3017928 [Cantharellus anzutake]
MLQKVKEGKEKVKEKFFKKKELQSQPLAGEPAPTLQSSARGNARGIVWNGVVGLLGIAEQSLDGVPVPGLKSAISVLLQVVNWLQQGTDSTYAIRQLENSVKFFNQSVSEPLKKYKEKGIPPELSQAIEILSACVYVSRVFLLVGNNLNVPFSNFDKAISPLKLYRGQNVVQQWADRDKIGGDIVAAGEGVRDAVSAFQVGILHLLKAVHQALINGHRLRK